MTLLPRNELSKKRIALFLPTLNGGGAERASANLVKGLSAQGIHLDLLLAKAEGVFLSQVPEEVRVVNLGAGRVAKAIIPLSRYIQQQKPHILLSQMSHANVAAVLARKLTKEKTKLFLIEQADLSNVEIKSLQDKFITILMRWLYPYADVIVGVSNGVTSYLGNQIGIAQSKLKVIYNPVVDDALLTKAKAPLDHRWFQEGSPPVFLAVGRLSPQKDFATLLKAFKLLKKYRAAHLLILGEGECRAELEALATELGVAEDVSMPGFVENPYAYMSRASAFVLSSQYEGLPTVLIEAMACGCFVIATDCPSGPREILEGGVYGHLVPVMDATALSAAMLQVLEAPVNREILVQRAMCFSVERAVLEYLSLMC